MSSSVLSGLNPIDKELITYFKGNLNNCNCSHLGRRNGKLLLNFIGHKEKTRIHNFLTAGGSFDNRYNSAFDLMQFITKEIHPVIGSVFQDLFFQFLPPFEMAARFTLPKHKDHVIHSTYVYLLGIYLADNLQWFKNDNICRIRKDIYQYYCSQKNLKLTFSRRKRKFKTAAPDFLNRWRMAAIFHDCAYPIEISIKQIKEFTGKSLKDIKSKISIFDHNVNEFKYLNHLNRPFFEMAKNCFPYLPEPTGTRLIARSLCQRLLNYYEIQEIDYWLKRHIKEGLENGNYDHAAFGALFFLKNVHYKITNLYDINDPTGVKKNKKLKKDLGKYERLYVQAIDAASAIFLHNFQYLEEEVFVKQKIESEGHPIAFLLKACDELHLWNRPKSTELEPISVDFDQYSRPKPVKRPGKVLVETWNRKKNIDDREFMNYANWLFDKMGFDVHKNKPRVFMNRFFKNFIWTEEEVKEISTALNIEFTFNRADGLAKLEKKDKFKREITKKVYKLLEDDDQKHKWKIKFLSIFDDTLKLISIDKEIQRSKNNIPVVATSIFFPNTYRLFQSLNIISDKLSIEEFKLIYSQIFELVYKKTNSANFVIKELFKNLLSKAFMELIIWESGYNKLKNKTYIWVNPIGSNEKSPQSVFLYSPNTEAMDKSIELLNDCLSYTYSKRKKNSSFVFPFSKEKRYDFSVNVLKNFVEEINNHFI